MYSPMHMLGDHRSQKHEHGATCPPMYQQHTDNVVPTTYLGDAVGGGLGRLGVGGDGDGLLRRDMVPHAVRTEDEHLHTYTNIYIHSRYMHM